MSGTENQSTKRKQEFLCAQNLEEKRGRIAWRFDMFQKRLRRKKQSCGCDSIVGFGQYHHKSERSRQEGDWFRWIFSHGSRTYPCILCMGTTTTRRLKTGKKHKTSGGMEAVCISISFPMSIQEALRKLIENSFLDLAKSTNPA